MICEREPRAFFHYFEEISAIPRMSYHEEAIAAYLVDFAKSHGLEYIHDDFQNVLIRKPATKGYEDRPTVMLQGHTDMVCEKNGDVEHDFLNDPLKLYLDGDLLRAKGTTLGADDGVAVAIMLAILDGAMGAHPALECLFTASEEVGLDGAKNFDYSKIKARRMVNIDSETLGEIIAGCAGGIRSELLMPFAHVPFAGNAVRISLKGLAGGHSGENIHQGRANANKLMGRLLAAVCRACNAHLVSVNGGSKDNAIPRECEAIIAVADADAAVNVLNDTAEQIVGELNALDKRFCVVCEPTKVEPSMMNREDTDRIVAMLSGVANGVFEMNRDIQGLVEFSRNLGVIHTQADAVQFIFSSRSSMESRLDASISELDAWMRALGGTSRHYARYPGWEYSPESPLRDAYAKAYRAVTGGEVTVKVIHAGLECGIIRSNIPDIDIISVAPNLQDLHCPEEALSVSSVEIFWNTLKHLLQQ